MTYTYTEVEMNHSQYEGETFGYGHICTAKYVESSIKEYRGNKYIEALPVPPDMNTIYAMCFVKTAGWESNNTNKPLLQKLIEIQQLESFRLPLPYYADLWNEIYMTITASYAKRTQLYSGTHRTSVILHGESTVNDGDLVANSKSTPAGFNMIGESGCGKSSALELALKYYPKVIRHVDENGISTIQIPYLFVTCPPDSNFSVLYRQIGKELDRYLGNSEPLIEKEIMGKSRSSLGEIRARVAKMIERYAVGLLIVDEVQHLNFSNQTERSFNGLKVLANETMVGIGVVGTSDVLQKIYADEQTARRVGKSISCDNYRQSKDYFNLIMKLLLQYKWFEGTDKFTPEITELIREESHGIIAYIVLIYEMVCMDYVTKKENGEPVSVNLDYVKGIIEKYFSIVKNALEKNYLTTRERDLQIQESIQKAQGRMAYTMDLARQQQEEKDAIELLDSQFSEDSFAKANIIAMVKPLYPDIPESRIMKVTDDIYNKASEKARKESHKLAQKVIAKLIKDHPSRKIKSSPELSEQTKSEIDDILKNHTMNPNIEADSKL